MLTRRRLWSHCVLAVASFSAVVGAVLLHTAHVWSQEGKPPLHEQIDRLVEAGIVGPIAGPASEPEFVRRVYLDLIGTIPTAAQLRAYLADNAPNRRTRLIDQLLASPQHARHLATAFDVAWMERLGGKQVGGAEWRAYLRDSFAANKPYDQLAREILSADGSDPATRPAARFVLDRECEPTRLTRDTGRMFFGKDFACCQCHDHPLISDYYQADFYGLFAFFQRSSLFNDETLKKVIIADKADGETTFASVFDRTKTTHKTRPRVPGGAEIGEPAIKPEEMYVVKPAAKVRPVPKYSRRLELAKELTKSRAFAVNIANRLWAVAMGRGLVDPVDMHHGANLPTHPEVLELLADEIVAAKYDLRAVLRQILLTRTYQRSLDLPTDLASFVPTVREKLPSWEAESQRIEKEYLAAKGTTEQLAKKNDESKQAQGAAVMALAKEQGVVAEKQKLLDAATTALKKAQEALTVQQETAKALAEAASKAIDAAKRLPTDKELAAAAETIRKRSEGANSAIAALNATFTQAKGALESAQQQHSKAAEAMKAATQQADTLSAQWADARVKSLKAAAALSKLESASIRASERVADAKTLIRFVDLSTAAKERGAVQGELDRARQVAQQVADALAKTKLAQQQLANDADLAAAAEKLGKRAGELAADVKAKEAALAKYPADATREKVEELRRTVVERSAERLAAAPLKPLSPEQLGMATMTALGIVENRRAAVAADWAKKNPQAKLDDPAVQAKRDREIEQLVDDQSQNGLGPYVSLYSAGSGQPQNGFFATADQALFYANNGHVRSWMAANAGSLADRLAKMNDPKGVADELYLNVLSRSPSSDEINDVTDQLAARPKDRTAAIQELTWALLTCTEFRFNH